MGLPWRFISASAGMVTFVRDESSCEELALPGKCVRLMLSPVPLRGLRMRPEQEEYTPVSWGGVATGVSHFRRGAEAAELLSAARRLRFPLPQPHTRGSNAFSFRNGYLRG